MPAAWQIKTILSAFRRFPRDRLTLVLGDGRVVTPNYEVCKMEDVNALTPVVWLVSAGVPLHARMREHMMSCVAELPVVMCIMVDPYKEPSCS